MSGLGSEAGDRAREVEDLAAARSWKAAAELARASVDAGHARGVIYTALARGLMRSGANAQALAVLDHLGEVERRKALGDLVRVQVLLELGRTHEARVQAERILLRDPDDRIAQRLLARARPEPPQRSTSDPLTTARRAVALIERGMAVRAVRVLRVLLAERGPDAELEGLLAEAHRRLDQPERRRPPRRLLT